ncbi:aspartate aminotransferase family protein [Paenibacillus sp. sptzw28]|uniref:pyridoxal phosphate-dependent decarboxylase family protein n=1 Tax=Paenibacillus sp. sptzw28 TaxID=715179 RepID=UPI001C6E73DF|nr:pyridoxal-dependent decarboxylase [Paenibacillus sp. sptzw28]QYR20253.1 aspartate aminotransferase family protein [Paenibacillus sp. sptzw28]
MKEIQALFPSEDGNRESRNVLLSLITKMIEEIDSHKNPSTTSLGQLSYRTNNYYQQIVEESIAPLQGIGLDNVLQQLLRLVPGHPYQSRNYLNNALPLASIPGIIGYLLTVILNGNNIYDVAGPAGAEAEVKVVAMMSKLAGYDHKQSWGYSTWGGQGAVFSGLRLAIAKQYPRAKEDGIPGNLYCFASETAHYSLLKSVEATGIGSSRLITVKCKSDHSMDEMDLKEKMEEVIKSGGVPVYIVATAGTTDSFGVDDIKEIKRTSDEITQKYGQKPVHIHADSAMGGFYCLFNHYDFEINRLGFEENVIEELMSIRERMQHLHIADSLCFDFHKLGQTPYATSLFLVKNGQCLHLLDLKEWDTPYVGNRGYGSYHTGFTLECSRMASSIAMYAALLGFGVSGYQQLLANYVHVNLVFRKKLLDRFSNVAVTNDKNPGPVTMFRFYPNGRSEWKRELDGLAAGEQIRATNEWNRLLFERLGKHRDKVFFGDTTRQCLVNILDSPDRQPVAAIKFFSISPFTTVEVLDDIIMFLSGIVNESSMYGLRAESGRIQGDERLAATVN